MTEKQEVEFLREKIRALIALDPKKAAFLLLYWMKEEAKRPLSSKVG
jgi:hypothetical protein